MVMQDDDVQLFKVPKPESSKLKSVPMKKKCSVKAISTAVKATQTVYTNKPYTFNETQA